MTYIRKELDNICIKFCPICEECETSHMCKNIKSIKKIIMDIMAEFENDD